MEQNIIAYAVSETAQRSFNTLLATLRRDIPESGFNLDEAVLIGRKKCAETDISMRTQWWLEDLVDKLVERINVNILYAVTDGGKEYRVIAYSMPYEDELYILKLESHQYGIADHLTVAFYDSLDTMFEEIKYHLQELMVSDAEVLEQEDARTTFSHFA